jgi:hypothetical protein
MWLNWLPSRTGMRASSTPYFGALIEVALAFTALRGIQERFRRIDL